MDLIYIVAIIAAVALVVLLAGVWFAVRRRHTSELRSQFGSEYDYEVARRGGRPEAEKELDARRDRVSKLDLRPLTITEYSAFSSRWTDAQARFVDDPSRAIVEGDLLCREVMEARGYPMGDFEQRAADISVDHPDVVSHYRAARRIAVANAKEEATTEELRQAMQHYRALFEDLLVTEEDLDESHRTEARMAAR